MGKLHVIFTMLCAVALSASIVEAKGELDEPKALEEWFQKLPHAMQKVSRLHFYFHDIVTDKNPTSITVAESNFTTKSPTVYGIVRMIDDPLTVGPEFTSKKVGRAQGFYGSADLKEVALVMNINFVFTDGYYNGSTLSILGRNPVFNEYREMPIVGGSGVFRLARGVATAKTYSFNPTSGNAVVEYNVVVLHY